MSKIVKVTLIETVLSEKGIEKAKDMFDNETSLDQEIDWEALGINKNEEDSSIVLKEDDFETTELEASIPVGSIEYYYKTPRKNTTSIKLKTGSLLTVKEDINYLDRNLHN